MKKKREKIAVMAHFERTERNFFMMDGKKGCRRWL
jgi:hypothetical protein